METYGAAVWKEWEVNAMKMKGSVLMKVSAVFCLIFGALSLVSTLFSISTDLKLISYGASSAVIGLTILFGLLEGAVLLFAGIAGIRNNRRPDKVRFMYLTAIWTFLILLITTLISILFITPAVSEATAAMTNDILQSAGLSDTGALAGSAMTAVSVIGTVVGVIIQLLFPLLLLAASLKNKEQIESMPEGWDPLLEMRGQQQTYEGGQTDKGGAENPESLQKPDGRQ
jgi:uncharacterized membrane protein